MKFKLNLYLRSSYINLEDFSILDQKQLYKIIKFKIKNMKRIKKENRYFIMKILKEQYLKSGELPVSYWPLKEIPKIKKYGQKKKQKKILQKL